MKGTYRDPIERSTRIVTSCAHCGAEKSIMVNAGDFLLWESGKSNINQCLSYLDKDEREMLISRTCNDCWTGARDFRGHVSRVTTRPEFLDVVRRYFPKRVTD